MDRSKLLAYAIALASLLSPFALTSGQATKPAAATSQATTQPATPTTQPTTAPAVDAAFRAAMAAADAQQRGPARVEPEYKVLVRGELCVWQSNTTLAYYKIVAGDDKVNGRGLTIGSDDITKPVHDVRVFSCMIQSNGDDGVSVWDYAYNVDFDNCWFFHLSNWPDRNDYRSANKCFLAGHTPGTPVPSYARWWTATHCLFNGGFRSPKIEGGRFQIKLCVLRPSRRNVWTAAQGNAIDDDFLIQYPMKVKGGDNPWADSWTKPVRPILLQDPLPDSLYFSGCRLFTADGDGNILSVKFASGPELCRLLPPGGGDDCNGCVDSDIDVPASVFRSTPWPMDVPLQPIPATAAAEK